jgi:hypothetical protein
MILAIAAIALMGVTVLALMHRAEPRRDAIPVRVREDDPRDRRR